MRPLRALVIYIAVVFIGGALFAPWLYRLAQLFAHSFPAGRPRAVPPFSGPFLSDIRAGRAVADVALARRGFLARHRPRPAIRPMEKNVRRIAARIPDAGRRRRRSPSASADGAGPNDVAAHKIVGDHFQRRRDGGRGRHAGGNFVSRRHIWRFAARALLAVGARHQQRDLRHRPFSPARGTRRPGRLEFRLVLLPQKLGGFADFHALVPGFFSLTLAGVLLGLAYQRTGNLYFSIGLHAGWIFCLAIYGQITVHAPHTAVWFWGGGKMTDGWLAFFVLAAHAGLVPVPAAGPAASALHDSQMTPLRRANSRNTGSTSVWDFFIPKPASFAANSPPRRATVMSAGIAGRRCASSDRRFANAAACPTPAI